MSRFNYTVFGDKIEFSNNFDGGMVTGFVQSPSTESAHLFYLERNSIEKLINHLQTLLEKGEVVSNDTR